MQIKFLDENPRETGGRRFTEQLSIAEELVSVEMIMELLSVLFFRVGLSLGPDCDFKEPDEMLFG